MNKLNLTGKVFNRLTVLREAPMRKQKSFWDCICICGNEVTVWGSALTTRQTQSCGCLQKERAAEAHRTHGMSHVKSPEYCAWVNMKTRCYNEKVADKDYFGKGITVCDRWLNSFENFYADMGKRPSNHHSIDRINNDKGYSPENCRWATLDIQATNKKRVVYYETNGIRKNLQEWSNYFGVHQANLMNTLKSKGIKKAYEFYYKKYNGKFPNGGKVTNITTPNYNPKKPIIGYREGLLVVFESKSIREMSRLTGLHHARIQNSVYKGVSYKGWKFELI